MLWAMPSKTRPQGDLSRAGGQPQQLQFDRVQDSAEYLEGAPRKCCWWPTLTGPRERLTHNLEDGQRNGRRELFRNVTENKHHPRRAHIEAPF